VSNVHRGGIYRAAPFDRLFLVVSINNLNDAGTAIVVEVVDEPLTGLRSMLAIPLGDNEPVTGAWALSWRINFMNSGRLSNHVGDVQPDTLARVVSAINAAIEP
jgi:mRNA-degrading endonuclease toxin of MazEF toxin-antitoxin module